MSRQKTVKLTPQENEIISEYFYPKLMEKLRGKRKIIEPDVQGLIDYSNNLQEKIKNQNNQLIKDVQIAHIIDVNLIIDHVEDFDKFIKKLDKDWLYDVVVKSKTSQISNKIYKILVKVYKDEGQFNNFIQIVYESILQNNNKSFYHRMCNFFEEGMEIKNKDTQKYAQKLNKIKEFAICSEMARLLANALFKSDFIEDIIKKKKKGDIKIYDIPYTFQTSFQCGIFGTTSREERKSKKEKDKDKHWIQKK
ncbi:MAG: hypothetical protein P794_00205 [Epsilonproteobacteria bacterium (ex Lamellibrachia satsuma)]|nr:MAG: hypothetical protein P794_00205 [Epsilonproteobacteria bacterium (ex Lamellibrachia satsuma)]